MPNAAYGAYRIQLTAGLRHAVRCSTEVDRVHPRGSIHPSATLESSCVRYPANPCLR